MGETNPQSEVSESKGGQSVATLSSILADGRMVELLYSSAERSTRFAVWDGRGWEFATSVRGDGSEHLVPYSANNSLIKNNIVLFPSEPVEFGSTEALVRDLRSYIHRYVDVSESFERLAAYYALLTWVYDRFNELPYSTPRTL